MLTTLQHNRILCAAAQLNAARKLIENNQHYESAVALAQAIDTLNALRDEQISLWEMDILADEASHKNTNE